MSLILSGTDGLSDVDGSAATPAIRGTDANTGIFFPAADTIAFSEGGAEAMRIDSSGNVGIGLTPTAYRLTTNVASGDNTFGQYVGSTLYGYLQTSSNYVKVGTNAATPVIFEINGTEKARIDSSGNLGVGTTSPSSFYNSQLVVGSETASYGSITLATTSTGTNSIYFARSNSGAGRYRGSIQYDQTSDAITFRNAGDIERARIDSSGNLLVATTDSSLNQGSGIKLNATGKIGVVATSAALNDTYNYYNSTAGAYRFYVTNAGVINATSTTITAISDQRLKENVRDLDTGLDSIMALQPRRFDWKEGKGQDKKNVAGFIAQEFEDVFPECVSTSKAGADGIEYKNINHETLIPALVKAIQEQQALITQLTARITALEGA